MGRRKQERRIGKQDLAQGLYHGSVQMNNDCNKHARVTTRRKIRFCFPVLVPGLLVSVNKFMNTIREWHSEENNTDHVDINCRIPESKGSFAVSVGRL